MPQSYHAIQLSLFPTKICSICLTEKPLTEFYRESRNADGHRRDCITCRYISWGKDPASRRPKFRLPKDVGHKACNRCGVDKPFDQFPTNPSSGDGYKSICKACESLRNKERREANPEHRREQARKSYRKNIEHKRAYRRANRERLNTYWRNRRANDPEYRQRTNEYLSRYQSERREQVNGYVRKWFEKRPLKRTEYAMRYKARKQQVTIDEVDYQLILEQHDGMCYICEKQIMEHHAIEFDHIIPITRQGSHSYDNIKVVHAICNSRKSDKLLDEMTPFQRRGPAS